MRILHIITRRELRGAEVVARDMCQGLTARGHEVMLVGLFEPPDPHAADTLTDGLNVADLGGPKHRGFSLAIARALRECVRKFRPDVVHANAFNALKFAAVVKLLTGAQWPLVYRNVGVASQWVTRPGQRSWGRFLLRQVDRVLSVSDVSRADFAKTYRYPTSQIDIARQGVRLLSPVDKREARQRLLAAIERSHIRKCDPCHVLIHVGNFAPEKNHGGLVEAFAMIRQQDPQARLVLIGEGPLRPQIEKLIARRQLDDCVCLLGARSDAAQLVAGADLMLLSSHVEGIPGVVLEACAGAVPVVSTSVGGLAEIVEDGVSGRLTRPGDMSALAAAACELLASPQQRQTFGHAASEFVKRHHDFEAAVDQLVSLYSELLRQRNTVAQAG
jgi:glycosyltransferase involved in cell wall biosynthesis